MTFGCHLPTPFRRFLLREHRGMVFYERLHNLYFSCQSFQVTDGPEYFDEDSPQPPATFSRKAQSP